MKTPPNSKKYTVTWLSNHREKILRKRLNFIVGQTKAILKMLDENRSPNDILIQIFAVKGGVVKLTDDIFEDLLRKEIVHRLNTLSENPCNNSHSPETLAGIRKSFPNYQLKQLPEVLLSLLSEEQKPPLR